MIHGKTYTQTKAHKRKIHTITDKEYTGWAKKLDHIYKFITPVFGEAGRRAIYQDVQFFIGLKTDTLNIATFKYSLHKGTEITVH